MTETYFAAKLYVDNFRWAGVPFYVRTGKRLPVKSTEIVVEFKNMPDHVRFHTKGWTGAEFARFSRTTDGRDIHPLQCEETGRRSRSYRSGGNGFCQSCQVGLNTPEAYERLLTDAIAGDSTYFTRWDEVSLAWEFVDRIVDAWKTMDDLHFYPAGSWGPKRPNSCWRERAIIGGRCMVSMREKLCGKWPANKSFLGCPFVSKRTVF